MSCALEIERFDPVILWIAAMVSWQLAQDTSRAMELVSASLDIG